jgi:hypothetical protein
MVMIIASLVGAAAFLSRVSAVPMMMESSMMNGYASYVLYYYDHVGDQLILP